MKTKSFLFTTIILYLLISITSCEKEENFQSAILGKWKIEATGLTEDELEPYDPYNVNKDYFEFLSDNTVWHFCATCVDEKYFQAATYKIDSEHFSWYTLGSDEPEMYYYEFYDDKLKITKVTPRYPGNLMIKISNVMVYKRVK